MRWVVHCAACVLFGAAAAGAAASSTQSYQINELRRLAEIYFQQNGTYPVTDESGTWFEKLVAVNYIHPSSLRFGTTEDGSLPLDAYGRPLVYEVLDPAQPGSAVVRSVGRDGVDNHGAGDDWDSRWGPNLGYWYKRPWPAFFAHVGSGWLLALVFTAIVYRRTRRVSTAAMTCFFTAGLVVGVGCAIHKMSMRAYASHLPDAGDAAILWSLAGIPAGLVMLGVRRARIALIKRRLDRGLCPQCGYDLRGQRAAEGRRPSAVSDAGCPECGWGRSVS